jgi:hypothetical protein
MGSDLGTRGRLAVRAGALAVTLSVLAPASAHADLWCWLFNSGCDGSRSTSSQATSSGTGAPEIDPGALAGAIALAAGGVAMLNDRVRRRRR